MFFESITVLGVLSVTATISTITLFFCGIPICINIYKRRGTKDISGAPFLMGVLGASYWLRYGLLKMDYAMITVNITAVTLMTSYLIFYFFYTTPKLMISLEISAVVFMISIMAFLVQIYGNSVIHPLGFACMTFNIINFGAPLAGLRVVLRQRSCETLPLPLCTANFAVSSQWCLYGVLIRDIYLVIPNGIGMTLALIQLALFVIFPMKEGKTPLAKRLCGIDCSTRKKDVEFGKVANEKSNAKKSWIVDKISPKHLNAVDDDTKKDSKPTKCDGLSMNGSLTTEITDSNQSRDSFLRKLDGSSPSSEKAIVENDEEQQTDPKKEVSTEQVDNKECEDEKKDAIVTIVNTV